MNMEEWRASRARAGPLEKPKNKSVITKPVVSEKKYVKPEKPKTWKEVWTWLKPKLKEAGRTTCEFDFIEHVCKGPLDPCHSKKRRKGKVDPNDIYAVALGCRNAHDIIEGIKLYKPLGRRVRQPEMERFVMQAINAHGGLILP